MVGEPPGIAVRHAYEIQFVRVQLSRVLIEQNARGSVQDMCCVSVVPPKRFGDLQDFCWVVGVLYHEGCRPLDIYRGALVGRGMTGLITLVHCGS